MLSVLGILSFAIYFLYGAAAFLCMAIGLFYLSELVEEYTVATGKIIRISIFMVIFAHFTLPFMDGFSWLLVIAGVGAHMAYFQLLSTFPAFNFSSGKFLISFALLVLHHVIAFASEVLYGLEFPVVLTYFTFFVWFVPFLFLISLSANDYVLPQTGEYTMFPESRPLLATNDDLVSSFLKGKRRSLFYLLSYLKDQLPVVRPKKLY